MNLIKLSIFTGLSLFSNGQLMGAQKDPSGNGCSLDGGYSWCKYLNECIRPWETECIAAKPVYPLITDIDLTVDCTSRRVCPPAPPCPMPYMGDINMDSCRLITNTDECGCFISCPSYDCTNQGDCNQDTDCNSDQFCRDMGYQPYLLGGRRLQPRECIDKSGEGESCGGYTLPQYQSRCMDGLECANTMGPMIADAPGTCAEPCHRNETRDDYGKCIGKIPSDCASWYDGCNTCSVNKGKVDACTLMYCFSPSESKCTSYYKKKTLNIGDVCYRFCEDNSQEHIDRKKECPTNTQCISNFNKNSVSMIAYDSCDDRAWTCSLPIH